MLLCIYVKNYDAHSKNQFVLWQNHTSLTSKGHLNGFGTALGHPSMRGSIPGWITFYLKRSHRMYVHVHVPFLWVLTRQIFANLCTSIPPSQPPQHNKPTASPQYPHNLDAGHALSFALNWFAEVAYWGANLAIFVGNCNCKSNQEISTICTNTTTVQKNKANLSAAEANHRLWQWQQYGNCHYLWRKGFLWDQIVHDSRISLPDTFCKLFSFGRSL